MLHTYRCLCSCRSGSRTSHQTVLKLCSSHLRCSSSGRSVRRTPDHRSSQAPRASGAGRTLRCSCSNCHAGKLRHPRGDSPGQWAYRGDKRSGAPGRVRNIVRIAAFGGCRSMTMLCSYNVGTRLGICADTSVRHFGKREDGPGGIRTLDVRVRSPALCPG
jgi:hypothetical protein